MFFAAALTKKVVFLKVAFLVLPYPRMLRTRFQVCETMFLTLEQNNKYVFSGTMRGAAWLEQIQPRRFVRPTGTNNKITKTAICFCYLFSHSEQNNKFAPNKYLFSSPKRHQPMDATILFSVICYLFEGTEQITNDN